MCFGGDNTWWSRSKIATRRCETVCSFLDGRPACGKLQPESILSPLGVSQRTYTEQRRSWARRTADIIHLMAVVRREA